MKMFTLGLLALCLVIGCSPRVPTLDEEIAQLEYQVQIANAAGNERAVRHAERAY